MKTYTRVVLSAILLAASTTSWSDELTTAQNAYNSGDYEAAMAGFQPLAEAGNADAQFGIGQMYANGFGAPMDDAQALHWYGLAAEQGHGMAQYNLGVMHGNGWGVPQSDEEAVKWYTMAADQGVTDAQVSLGQLYNSSFSAIGDKTQAYKWFTIASKLGDIDAEMKRETLIPQMTAEEVSAADGLVSTWIEDHGSLVASE